MSLQVESLQRANICGPPGRTFIRWQQATCRHIRRECSPLHNYPSRIHARSRPTTGDCTNDASGGGGEGEGEGGAHLATDGQHARSPPAWGTYVEAPAHRLRVPGLRDPSVRSCPFPEVHHRRLPRSISHFLPFAHNGTYPDERNLREASS